MANRTLQFFGSAYGNEPVSVSATFNGIEIFNGVIPTINGPVNTVNPWTESAVLFTSEISASIITNIPMTVTVSGNGTASFGRIEANYLYQPNAIYSTEDYAILMDPQSSTTTVAETMNKYAVPPFTPAEMTLVESTNPGDTVAKRELLNSKGLQPFTATGSSVFNVVNTTLDCRDTVVIDGTPVTTADAIPSPVSDTPWNWQIASGSTMSCQIELPVLIDIPPHLVNMI